jgi:aminopeptidase
VRKKWYIQRLMPLFQGDKSIITDLTDGQPQPGPPWKPHLANLEARVRYLNARRYTALHYTGPGTNLTLGLSEGHLWYGGNITSQNGINFVPNIPTEEVFTLPHKDCVNGIIRASRPLSHAGTLIENFSFTFKDGKVVDFSGEKGKDTLRELLDTDEAARRLGEVALVPHSSPVSQTGVLFHNTLFDENAASHPALGRAYQFTL